jgi:hypothetical protein
MVNDVRTRSIYTSCEFEDLERSIECIFFIFFFGTITACRCRKRDESITFVSFDIDMRMRSCPFMKESATDILVGDDPLLRYRIYSLLDSSTLHIVGIGEYPTREEHHDHSNHDHKFYECESCRCLIERIAHNTLIVRL